VILWKINLDKTLCYVDRASLYNLVNKANLVHHLFLVNFQSLLGSGDYVPIIRRKNCVYATLGTCYSVWMIVWYAYQTVIHNIYIKDQRDATWQYVY
jgi:hypothetical protein